MPKNFAGSNRPKCMTEDEEQSQEQMIRDTIMQHFDINVKNGATFNEILSDFKTGKERVNVRKVMRILQNMINDGILVQNELTNRFFLNDEAEEYAGPEDIMNQEAGLNDLEIKIINYFKSKVSGTISGIKLMQVRKDIREETGEDLTVITNAIQELMRKNILVSGPANDGTLIYNSAQDENDMIGKNTAETAAIAEDTEDAETVVQSTATPTASTAVTNTSSLTNQQPTPVTPTQNTQQQQEPITSQTIDAVLAAGGLKPITGSNNIYRTVDGKTTITLARESVSHINTIMTRYKNYSYEDMCTLIGEAVDEINADDFMDTDSTAGIDELSEPSEDDTECTEDGCEEDSVTVTFTPEEADLVERILNKMHEQMNGEAAPEEEGEGDETGISDAEIDAITGDGSDEDYLGGADEDEEEIANAGNNGVYDAAHNNGGAQLSKTGEKRDPKGKPFEGPHAPNKSTVYDAAHPATGASLSRKTPPVNGNGKPVPGRATSLASSKKTIFQS